METFNADLLLVAFVAALAPLLAELPRGFRLPVVAVEILLGIFIGPQILGWASPDGVIAILGQLGLTFLLFLVGIGVNSSSIRGTPLILATSGWLFSFLIAMFLAIALNTVGLIHTPPLLAAVALSTTALGVVSPILEDTGELDTGFGTLLLGAAAMGEFGPMIVISLLLIPTHPAVLHSIFLVIFIAVAFTAAYFAIHMRSSGLLDRFREKLHGGRQWPVRLCILVQALFVALSAEFGLNVVLGAFAAGMVVGLVSRGEEGNALRNSLDAIGYGFLIPFFFIGVGMRFNLAALWAGPLVPVQVIVLLLLFLTVRGAPVLVYRRELGIEDRLPFALYSATGLPLIAVISELGVHSGLITADHAAELLSAAMLSVLVFPILAMNLRKRREPAG